LVKRLLACSSFVALSIAVRLSAEPADAQAHRMAAPAPAASAAPSAAPAERADGETPDAVTEHSVVVDGRAIAYTARAATLTLRDEQEKPTARIFYTAYTVNEPGRPVTFIYNGGPGSSTMWLRMGSFGPVRVLAADGTAQGPPPFRIVDNPNSLIDKSDLVFIDMPASGFGRLLDAGKPKDFFGIDQDANAFAQFIQRYLTRFDRWNSPKFLFGESYGTTRSAALGAVLQRQGVQLDGIVLLSSILNFGFDYGNGGPIGGGDWPYVFNLPTEAATAWYHGKVANKPADLAAYLHDVERWAMTDYVDALAQGDRLSGARKDAVVRRLASYLGVSEQYVRDSNIRVPYDRFTAELLRPEGKVVGRLDSRYFTYTTDGAAAAPRWDPTDATIDAPYTTAINTYLRQDLKYETSLQYRTNIYGLIYADGGSWDMRSNRYGYANVAPDLAQTMVQNPNLRVFSANGYYDFATPYFATVYTLKHLNVPPELERNVSFGFYPAGHMVYLSEPALAQFKHDLSRWYDAAQGR
jgi:carboxypeptidase C (cathepsin A)